MSQQEDLCRPLLKQLCEYFSAARAGAQFNMESLKWDIQLTLDDIRRKCESDPSLKREFERIEQPLVFFIDYTVKEGHFPFSASWQPIARSYKELSGDEKFFDQLSEALEDPDASDRLKIFYLMMGLGFDGCYKGDSEYVERRMRLCAVRCNTDFKLLPENLISTSPVLQKHKTSVRRFSKRFWCIFWCCIAFLTIAFAWNCFSFNRVSCEYRQKLQDAEKKLNPVFVEKTEKKQNPVEVKHE